MTFALIFDTETTGLPAGRRTPVTDPGYPRIVELAAVLYDLSSGREEASFSFLVLPGGWTIPPNMVHGIDDAKARALGVPARVAIAALTNLRRVADITISHNVMFDVGMVQSELHRLGQDYNSLFPANNLADTAELGEPLCALPPTDRMVAAGYGHKFKKPNLGELHKFLFGEVFEGSHRALADVRATARCYMEIVKMGN